MSNKSYKGDSPTETGIALLAIFSVLMLAEYFIIVFAKHILSINYVGDISFGLIKYGNTIRLLFVCTGFLFFVLFDKGDFLQKITKAHKRLIKACAWVFLLVSSLFLVTIRELQSDWFVIVYPVAYSLYILTALIVTNDWQRRKGRLLDEFGFKKTWKLYETDESVNFYSKTDGYLNIINIFRGGLIVGNPGSGKTWFYVKPLLETMVRKGFTGLIYDFKSPELVKWVHDSFINFGSVPAERGVDGRWKKPHSLKNDRRKIWVIDFSDLSRSHRVNPVHPDYMKTALDANEMATTILFNLNPSAIEKKDFWTMEAIKYFQAILWFLRCNYPEQCTLPHAVAIALMPYEVVLAALKTHPDTTQMIESFLTADRKNAEGQIAGQVSSLQSPIAQLNSPELSYGLSESDFKLTLNNPDDPGICIIGNNPKRKMSYGPVLSLITNVVMKLLNEPGKLPSMVITDEAPTMYVPDYDSIGPATSRSNKVSYWFICQSLSQIYAMYGDKVGQNIIGTLGTHIYCQLSIIDDATKVSRLIGKEDKEQESFSYSKKGTQENSNVSIQKHSLIEDEHITQLEPGRSVGKLSETDKKFPPVFNFKPDITVRQHDHNFNKFIFLQEEDASGKVIKSVNPTHEELLELAKVKHSYIKAQAELIIEIGAIESVISGKSKEEKVFPEHFVDQKRVFTTYGDPIDEQGRIRHRKTGKIIGTKEHGYWEPERVFEGVDDLATKKKGAK